MYKYLYLILSLLLLLACKVKKIESYTANTIVVNDSLQSDQNLDSIISPYKNGMSSKMNEVIGYTSFELVNEPVESKLGNFVVDVTFESAIDFTFKNKLSKIDTTNAIGLLNFGGLRAPINKGDITVGNVFELMPFDNEIVIVKLTPEKVSEMLAYLFVKRGQPIANAKAYLSSNKNILDIAEKRYNFDAPLYVVTSDYLASGGDKMNFLKSGKIIKTGILIRNCLIDFIKQNKGVVNSPIEGRIEFIK